MVWVPHDASRLLFAGVHVIILWHYCQLAILSCRHPRMEWTTSQNCSLRCAYLVGVELSSRCAYLVRVELKFLKYKNNTVYNRMKLLNRPQR